MSNLNILITGCNRGIGLELIKQYLKQKPKNLFATCRDPNKADELSALAKENKNLHILTLNATKHEEFEPLAKQVEDIVGDDGLNLLINNAGYVPDNLGKPPTPEMMRNGFEVNTIGPYFLSQSLLPLIKKASSANQQLPLGINRATIVMMSSSIASLAENQMGQVTAYRCSKVALNMAMINLSLELKNEGILVMSLHPGWVQTDLGGPRAQISTETSCKGMIETMQNLSEKDNGAFLRYDNTTIKW